MALRRVDFYWLPAALLIAFVGPGEPAIGDESPEEMNPALAAKVDELFKSWNKEDSPGCAVGIVQGGELIYSKGFGVANLDFQAPNTPQTVFEMASFSKTFTCICMALLMDEGKISPDDDLRKFVPEMHAFDPPIRIRDLIRCRSGLWDQVSIPILVGWENDTAHTAADFLSLLTGHSRLNLGSSSPTRAATIFCSG